MTQQPSAREPYEVTLSDGRRFIVESSDPQIVRRDFLIPGESVRVMAVKPIIVFDDLLTVHELANALSMNVSSSPHWRTLLDWANAGKIPCRRIGKKFVRFVERDVREAMGDISRTA